MAKGLHLLKKLTKGTAIGGIAGYAASKVTSSSAEADTNSMVGSKVGAITGLGIAAALPLAKSKTLREAGKAAGKVVFRRIRGRLVPIKVDKSQLKDIGKVLSRKIKKMK